MEDEDGRDVRGGMRHGSCLSEKQNIEESKYEDIKKSGITEEDEEGEVIAYF